MKFFIDTANVEDIKKANDMGVICGVTTNPSPVSYTHLDFNLLIESLKSGKGQLIAAGMTATPERAEQIDFSITYTLNGLILLVPKGSDIKTADDLAGKNIAVQESTTAHIYAQEELGIEPLAFKNANECATAVMGGKADAAILDLSLIHI